MNQMFFPLEFYDKLPDQLKLSSVSLDDLASIPISCLDAFLFNYPDWLNNVYNFTFPGFIINLSFSLF